jgi:cytochrome c553
MMRGRVYAAPFVVTATAAGAVAGWAMFPVRLQGQTVPHYPERAALMRAHFDQVMTIHTAVIRGDLAAVAPAAKLLAEQGGPASLPAGSAPHVAAMRQAARQAAQAKDIVSAAFSTAVMLSTCGDCHRAVGTMPAAPLDVRPELGWVVGHMLEHQRAADQLLQGLIVPSNSLWRAGAEGLVAAPLHPKDLPVNSTLRREMAPTEERIHRIASDAIQATDSRARASFYAQILSGCADCHKLNPKLWGPKPR